MGTETRAAPFGILLQHYRIRAALTQEELAERAGISRRAISDLERGSRTSPYPSTLRRLTAALALTDMEAAALFEAAHRASRSTVSAPDGPPPQRERVPTFLQPTQLTSFVGRQIAIADVTSLLRDQPLVSLTGPGGVGKTRLAMALAESLAPDFAAGVWFVELAALADARLVPQAVATALGIRERPGRSQLDTLEEALLAKRLLLVLDNCEHVLETCAELADRLLRTCRELRILATSREPLNIAGETVWVVPPLSLPDSRVADLHRSEALQLFVDRARSASRMFSLDEQNARAVVQICQRLDGIPLALELAAARVRLLTAEQIAARLDDHFALLSTGSRTAPMRHQTLRATVAWSYGLLTGPERIVLEQLSVFAGGWTLESAEAVCLVDAPGTLGPDGHTERSVLDLLGRLVDKSLVMTEFSPGAQRYRFLEMLRQYGAERLLARGTEPAIRYRHAEHFAALLERAEEGLTGASQPAWLDVLEREHDNIRAALKWAIEHAQLGLGLRIGWIMWRFWWVRGYLSEGRQRLAELLDLAGVGDAHPLLARGHLAVGLLAVWQGEYSVATWHLEKALIAARQVGDTRAAAYALAFLGRVARDQGDEARAISLATEAVELLRSIDDAWALGVALTFLGFALEPTDLDAADCCFNESANIFSALGNRWDLARPWRGLADVAYRRGDLAAAREFVERSIVPVRERGDDWSLAMRLLDLGYIALAQRNHRQACELFMESLATWRALAQTRGVILCLAGLTSVLVAQGRFLAAARLQATVDAKCRVEHVSLKPTARIAYQSDALRIRQRIGPTEFRRAWSEGSGLALEDALTEAVEQVAAVGQGQPAQALSQRELMVAKLIADGLTNRQIGVRLIISERTVDRHVENILKKLRYESRAQIAAHVFAAMGTDNAPFAR